MVLKSEGFLKVDDEIRPDSAERASHGKRVSFSGIIFGII